MSVKPAVLFNMPNSVGKPQVSKSKVPKIFIAYSMNGRTSGMGGISGLKMRLESHFKADHESFRVSWVSAGDGRSPGKSDFSIPVFVVECPDATADIEGQVTHVKPSVG